MNLPKYLVNSLAWGKQQELFDPAYFIIPSIEVSG